MPGPSAQRDPSALGPVTIATNNGDIGGGEVMLLGIARALEEIGVDTTVVAPSSPAGLAEASRRAGHRTVTLRAHDRVAWMRALRAWDRRERLGVLWCNGLVPAVATAGRPARIVHLHQRPIGPHAPLAAVARRGALRTIVPSRSMTEAVHGAEVFPNWVAEPRPVRRRPESGNDPASPFVLGFLGRPSLDKGVHVLAEAVQLLSEEEPGRYRLFLAGEPRFVDRRQRRRVESALATIDPYVVKPGWIEPAVFFSSIDLFVAPSVRPESFGLVVAEAMAAGVPLLVSSTGAFPEVVGEDSLDTVPAADPVALAAAIKARADEIDPPRVQQYRARWRDEFSPQAGRERTHRLLDSIAVDLAAGRALSRRQAAPG